MNKKKKDRRISLQEYKNLRSIVRPQLIILSAFLGICIGLLISTYIDNQLVRDKAQAMKLLGYLQISASNYMAANNTEPVLFSDFVTIKDYPGNKTMLVLEKYIPEAQKTGIDRINTDYLSLEFKSGGRVKYLLKGYQVTANFENFDR